MTRIILLDSLTSDQRQLAALIVKNSIVGKSEQMSMEIEKWIKIPIEQRNEIKKLVSIQPQTSIYCFNLPSITIATARIINNR